MEEKNPKLSKFEELAEKRVAEALKRIRLVGKLANRNNYHYTDGHIKQIMRALEAEAKNLRTRFNSDKDSGTVTFKFTL